MFNKLCVSKVLFLVKCVCGLLASSGNAQDNRVSHNTPEGVFLGTRENIDRTQRVFYAFRGIEFAKAERWQVSKCFFENNRLKSLLKRYKMDLIRNRK